MTHLAWVTDTDKMPKRPKKRRSAKTATQPAPRGSRSSIKWIIGGSLALGLVICVALAFIPAEDPSANPIIAEPGRPAPREIPSFSPPQRLYPAIDPNSSAGPEALLETQTRLVAEIRSEALALVEHLRVVFPRDENADILLGDIYQGVNEDALSIAAWQLALTKNPQRADLYEKLGEAAAAQRDEAQALTFWKQGLQINTKTPNLRWHIANAYLDRGEPVPAIDLLRQECSLTPRAARNYFLLGQCYRQVQQYEQAAQNYRKAVEVSPDYYNAYYGLANVYRMMKEMDRAKEALETFRTVKKRVDASEGRQIQTEEVPQARKRLAAYYLKAYRFYLRHQQIRSGESLLQRAIVIAPEWPISREKLAAHHHRLGRPAEALRLFQQAQHLAPNQPMYAVNIGTLYRQAGQYQQAERQFRQVIARFPDSPQGYRELVNLHLKTGKHGQETLALAQRAVQLKGSADHYYTLSKVQQVNGNFEMALSAIETAIRLDPQQAKYREFNAIIRRQPPTQ